MITLTIPGKPFAKQRPRATRTGRVYTPKETVSFERAVGQIAAAEIKTPMSGPVRVSICATFAIPKSWTKKKTAALFNRHHTQKPDADNCVKAILDALNQIAWADDGQVSEIYIRKMWGSAAKTVVHIEPISWQGDI